MDNTSELENNESRNTSEARFAQILADCLDEWKGEFKCHEEATVPEQGFAALKGVSLYKDNVDETRRVYLNKTDKDISFESALCIVRSEAGEVEEVLIGRIGEEQMPFHNSEFTNLMFDGKQIVGLGFEIYVGTTLVAGNFNRDGKVNELTCEDIDTPDKIVKTLFELRDEKVDGTISTEHEPTTHILEGNLHKVVISRPSGDEVLVVPNIIDLEGFAEQIGLQEILDDPMCTDTSMDLGWRMNSLKRILRIEWTSAPMLPSQDTQNAQ